MRILAYLLAYPLRILRILAYSRIFAAYWLAYSRVFSRICGIFLRIHSRILAYSRVLAAYYRVFIRVFSRILAYSRVFTAYSLRLFPSFADGSKILITWHVTREGKLGVKGSYRKHQHPLEASAVV